MPIALVTDSNAMLGADLIERYGVRVVPIPVNVNGTEYLEGVDLDADEFYAFFDDGPPQVSTSQPAPGAFAEVYAACAAAGATEIISAHLMREISGTLNSARLGAQAAEVPVHLVDTRTASFGVGCCVWAMGDALAAGADAAEAVAVGERLAERLYSVTALGAAELLQASGRAPEAAAAVQSGGAGIELLLSSPGGGFEPGGRGQTVDEVCDLMAAAMHADGEPIKVAIGIADESAAPFNEGLEARLRERDDVAEIVHYRIGPSIGAVTGPGTAGGFWFRV